MKTINLICFIVASFAIVFASYLTRSSNWLGVAIQAVATVALVWITFIYVMQNRKQMEYIQRPYNIRYIIESINAEIEQNLNLHEQICNKLAKDAFPGVVNYINYLKDKKHVKAIVWKEQAKKAITTTFDTAVWDEAKLKISEEDLDKPYIHYDRKSLEDNFGKGYPFNKGYTLDDLFKEDDKSNKSNEEKVQKEDTSFYHRLKATYSRLKIQNEIAIKLRYATSSHPKDQEEKTKNYFYPENLIEVLNDLVRSKSYLQQALEQLRKES